MQEHFHKHKCKFCGFVWQHHDINDESHNFITIPGPQHKLEDNFGAHECPSCHRCNWGLGIYTGAEEPRVQNGLVLLIAPQQKTTIHPDQNHTFGD